MSRSSSLLISSLSSRPDPELCFSFLTSFIQSPTSLRFPTPSLCPPPPQMGTLRHREPGVAEQQQEWTSAGLFPPSSRAALPAALCHLQCLGPWACTKGQRMGVLVRCSPGHLQTTGPISSPSVGLKVHSSSEAARGCWVVTICGDRLGAAGMSGRTGSRRAAKETRHPLWHPLGCALGT